MAPGPIDQGSTTDIHVRKGRKAVRTPRNNLFQVYISHKNLNPANSESANKSLRTGCETLSLSLSLSRYYTRILPLIQAIHF